MTNIDIERSIIGSLLTNPSFAGNTNFGLLTDKHFTDSQNAKIFEVLKELIDESKAVDMLILFQALKAKNVLEYCGGAGYVSSLTSAGTWNEDVFEQHILILCEKFMRKELITVAVSIQNLAVNETLDVFDLMDKSNTLFFDLNNAIETKQEVTLNEVFVEAIKQIEERKVSGLQGLSSGIFEVDDRVKGFGTKGLHVIAGRPGMGKTTFALSMFNRMVCDRELTGAFFTLEMSASEIAQKLFAINGVVPSWKISNGKLNDNDWNDVHRAVQNLLGAGCHIFDNYFKIDEIARKIKQLKNKHKELSFVMVDYLQLISVKGKGSREQEISYISRTLKNLASELDIAIFPLAQLSRDVEKRGGDKRPNLSDLRESGAIEQDASTVLFCYRPSYYGLKGENGEDLDEDAFLLVGKNRFSDTKDIHLFYNKSINQEWMSLSHSSKGITPNTDF